MNTTVLNLMSKLDWDAHKIPLFGIHYSVDSFFSSDKFYQVITKTLIRNGHSKYIKQQTLTRCVHIIPIKTNIIDVLMCTGTIHSQMCGSLCLCRNIARCNFSIFMAHTHAIIARTSDTLLKHLRLSASFILPNCYCIIFFG